MLRKSSSQIFYSENFPAIIWSDESQNLKIQVIMIDIVTMFNSFIQKACEWDCVCPHNHSTNEASIQSSFHCYWSLLWSSIKQIWSSMEIISLLNFYDQI